MEPTPRFEEKLRAVVQVLDIPIRDRWPELDEEANIYSYWEGVGLLDAECVRELRGGRAVVEPTRVIRRFFRNVDYYWSPRIYAGRSAADFGSGYGP